MTKWQRELVGLAREFNCALSGGGSRHYRFSRAGCQPVFASASPSDRRTLKIIRKQLERNTGGVR